MRGNVLEFVAKLNVHFGEPKFDVPDASKKQAMSEWTRAMKRNFEGFPDEVLARAADDIIATRQYRSFPLISECKKAVIEADKSVKAERPRLAISASDEGQADNHDYRERIAYELLLGPMGRQAAKEGWVYGLFNFVRDHMRLPSPTAHCGDKRGLHREHGPCSEVECLKRGSAGVMTTLENLYRNQYDILPSKRADWEQQRLGFIAIGETMIKRREALENYVKTGVLP